MASITICNRTVHGKSDRMKLKSVNFKGTVNTLKELISKTINLPKSEFEVIYCGQKLEDQKPLETYGLKDGITLFILKRSPKEIPKSQVTMNEMATRQLVANLQSALLNPAYRCTVEKLLNSSEEMEKLIAAVPGLDEDPIAVSMLHDQELLAILAHPGNIRDVVNKHPAFGQAAMIVCNAVNEEGSRRDTDRITTGSYYLDQMSDDEDESSINRPGPSSGSGITASQLAAALAAATGMPPQSGASNQPPPDMAGGITPDFFQQAIRQAQNSASETQLQQLRDMGITDEALARRALQATGGDLQAALDILFGDGHF